eukprot:842744_1
MSTPPESPAYSPSPSISPPNSPKFKGIRGFSDNSKTRKYERLREEWGRADVHFDGKALPRHINVEEFAQARASELKALFARHSTVTPTGKTAMQSLPRHLRRRAMSHNIHMLPRRLRAKAAEDQSATKKPKCRRKRRRPKFTMESHARRQRKHKWLETHLWSAKRMRMANLWGYRLALTPTGKGKRFFYKAGRHLCTLFDASFMECIELSGEFSDILSLFDGLTPPNGSGLTRVSNQMYLNGSREGTVLLFAEGKYPSGIIGPVKFLWKPSQSKSPSRSLWLWVHAAIFNEVHSLLTNRVHGLSSKVSVISRASELLRFELTGARCQSVLNQVIRQLAECSPETQVVPDRDEALKDTKKDIWSFVRALDSPCALPAGCVIGLKVADPRESDPAQPFVASAKSSRSKETPPNPPTTSHSCMTTWPSGAAMSPLWDTSLRHTFTRSITGCDPPGDDTCETEDIKMNEDTELQTSEKEPDSSKPVQLQTPSSPTNPISADETPSKSQNSDPEIGKCPTKSPDEPPLKKPKRKPRRWISHVPAGVSVMLIQRPGSSESGGFGGGWDLVLPAGWGMAFWKALVYAGARVIGIEERDSQAFERGVPSFPASFPDAPAGQMFAEWCGARVHTVHARKPPAKRLNYDRMRVSCPFVLDWAGLLGVGGQSAAEMSTADSSSTDASNLVLPTTSQTACSKSTDVSQDDKMDVDASPNDCELSRSCAQFHVIREPLILRLFRQFDVLRLKSEFSARLTASLLPMSLRMVRRGSPADNALICAPTCSDFARLKRVRECARTDGEKVGEPYQEPKGRKDSKATRTTIGYVSHGMFSLARGRGYGEGFCSAEALLKVLEVENEMNLADTHPRGLVLVRNINS